MVFIYRPLRGVLVVTSPFGADRRLRLDDGTIRDGEHLGTDYAADESDDVYAMGDAVVAAVTSPTSSCGLGIVYDDAADGRVTYCHLSKVFVGPGDRIRAGDVVGKAGRTGGVTGPHLHVQWAPAHPARGTLQDIGPVVELLDEPPERRSQSAAAFAFVLIGLALLAASSSSKPRRRRSIRL